MRRSDLLGRLIGLGNAYRRAGRLEEVGGAVSARFRLYKRMGIEILLGRPIYTGVWVRSISRRRIFLRRWKIFKRSLLWGKAGKWRVRSDGRLAVSAIFYARLESRLRLSLTIRRQSQQIESTRSLLESEEYRQSYFEGGSAVYARMIRASCLQGEPRRRSIIASGPIASFLGRFGSKVQLSRVKSGLLAGREGAAGANCWQ